LEFSYNEKPECLQEFSNSNTIHGLVRRGIGKGQTSAVRLWTSDKEERVDMTDLLVSPNLNLDVESQ